MTSLQAVVLGLVQGLTEFLPVSSSGHLVLFQEFFGLREASLVFEIFLHLATLVAVVIFFAGEMKNFKRRDWLVVVVGTVPAAFVGFFFDELISSFFSSVTLVSFALLVTGLFNWLSNQQLKKSVEATTNLNFKKGLVIGGFQALALIPGISRSGSTVFAGLKQSLTRLQAFRFSFILSIPAILGATFLQLLELSPAEMSQLVSPPYLLGAVSAFISGLVSLFLLKQLVKKANLNYFAYYCWTLGVLVSLSVFF